MGNPFEYCMGQMDFELMMQDPALTIRFDYLCSKIAAYYQNWPRLDPSPQLRDFVFLCTRFYPVDRPSCAELMLHAFALQGLSMGTTAVQQWLERTELPPIA